MYLAFNSYNPSKKLCLIKKDLETYLLFFILYNCIFSVSSNSSIVKCGFPVSQLNKYLYIFDKENYKVKIVNSKSMLSYSQKDYLTNNKIKKLLKKLSTTNSSNLSISQTYDFIDSISSEAQNIIAEIEK